MSRSTHKSALQDSEQQQEQEEELGWQYNQSHAFSHGLDVACTTPEHVARRV
jgi:hypothetical protein